MRITASSASTALLALSLTARVEALEVWVDAATGSDSNDGSASAPYATLQHACDTDTADPALVVHVRPGTYRERVQIRRDGTHLVVDEADRGQAVLTGSEASSSLSWTQGDPAGLPAAAAGHVWWADLAGWEAPPQIVTQEVGGALERLPVAREPDWTVTTEWKWHENWETAGIAPLRYWADEPPGNEASAHYLSAPFLVSQWGDLTGARAWIKDGVSGHDTYSREILQHFVGEGTIELATECHISGGDDGLTAASKFFVEGAASLLDQEGEWFYEASSGRIYLRPLGGGDPSSLPIEIAAREQGIDIDVSDVLVDGLVLRGFNYVQDYWNTRASAIFVHSSSDGPISSIAVRNAQIEHAGRGIHLVASSADGNVTIDGVTVADTHIAHTDGHGMNVQSWPNDAIGIRNVTVERCHIEDTGFRNPEPTNSAGSVSFSRVAELRLLDSEVSHGPHNVVQVNYGCDGVLIKGNHVHHCGLNAADNGCVKFWNNTDTFDPTAPRSILATENLVHDSMGWAYSSEVNEWWQTTGLSGSGFYCDYYQGVTFFRNVVHTVGQTAIWPNTPSNRNWAVNNTVLNARHGASCSRQSMSTPDQGEALVMNNLFMLFTTWGFPEDYYWGQLESGVYYSRTDELLVSHHNAFHDVLHDMLYVDESNSGHRYTTLADVTANTPYEQGSIDIGGDPTSIIADPTGYDARPVAGSAVIDAGDALPPEIGALFERLGLVLAPPEGGAYDIGAIEGTAEPWLRVTYPNGGEILPTGAEAVVRWDSAAFVGPVSIEVATSYATSPAWQTLVAVTTNDGAEAVTLPAVHDASCRIRIREASDGSPEDLSDADFEIGDAILVTSPTGGETLTIGQNFDITWSSGGVSAVDVELSRDAGSSWELLADALPADDGVLSWVVTGPAASECLVRIRDDADQDPVGLSADTFSIGEPSPVVPAGEAAAADEEGGCDCRLSPGGDSRAPRHDARALAALATALLAAGRRRRCRRASWPEAHSSDDSSDSADPSRRRSPPERSNRLLTRCPSMATPRMTRPAPGSTVPSRCGAQPRSAPRR